MTVSVLADAPFEKHTLTYSAPTADPNNPTTGTLTAFVSTDTTPQLRYQPGADDVAEFVRAELVKPLTLPAGVAQGSTLALTWRGRPARITIKSITGNDLVGVPFGDLILGELRYE